MLGKLDYQHAHSRSDVGRGGEGFGGGPAISPPPSCSFAERSPQFETKTELVTKKPVEFASETLRAEAFASSLCPAKRREWFVSHADQHLFRPKSRPNFDLKKKNWPESRCSKTERLRDVRQKGW